MAKWIRSAFWIGRPQPDQEENFVAAINEELIPAMRRFPGVAEVNALWPRKKEDNPPDIYCQVVVRFASPEDMALMLASEERAALRPHVLETVALFDGSLSHIDYEAV